MKREKYLNPKSLTSKLLFEMDEALDFWLLMGTNRSGVLKYGYEGMKRIKKAKERKAAQQAIKRMEQMRIIKIQKIADQYSVNLLLRGAIELFRLKVIAAKRLPEGIVCHVFFDIPESQRSLRDDLRRFLKGTGFICVQRSVWMIEKDVFVDLAMLFAVKGVKDSWVLVYKSSPMN